VTGPQGGRGCGAAKPAKRVVLLLTSLLTSARELALARVASDRKLRGAKRVREARWPPLAKARQLTPQVAHLQAHAPRRHRRRGSATAHGLLQPRNGLLLLLRRRQLAGASNASCEAHAASTRRRARRGAARALNRFSSSRWRPTESLPTRPVMRRGATGASGCSGAGPCSLGPAAHTTRTRHIAAARGSPPRQQRAAARPAAAAAAPCCVHQLRRDGRAARLRVAAWEWVVCEVWLSGARTSERRTVATLGLKMRGTGCTPAPRGGLSVCTNKPGPGRRSTPRRKNQPPPLSGRQTATSPPHPTLSLQLSSASSDAHWGAHATRGARGARSAAPASRAPGCLGERCAAQCSQAAPLPRFAQRRTRCAGRCGPRCAACRRNSSHKKVCALAVRTALLTLASVVAHRPRARPGHRAAPALLRRLHAQHPRRGVRQLRAAARSGHSRRAARAISLRFGLPRAHEVSRTLAENTARYAVAGGRQRCYAPVVGDAKSEMSFLHVGAYMR
jgi:hypothetical protein